MTEHEELQQIVGRLDAELADGLLDALKSDPEAVRELLWKEGFIGTVEEHSEPDLTDAEVALLEIIEELGNPKSSGEIQDIIEIEHPKRLDEYKSLKHRSWISDKVNSLVKKGYIGKYREGREIKFTPDPVEAVRRWALHNDKFASELTRSDAEVIATDTGMRLQTVRNAIQSLQAK